MKILLSSNGYQYVKLIIHFGCYLSAIYKVHPKRKKHRFWRCFLGGSSPNQGWEEGAKG